MGIDTYVVLPSAEPALARDALSPPESVAHVGSNYVVLYKGDRFSEVRDDPRRWGRLYARELPARLRAELDPRGLLACPEVGQGFSAATYAELVRAQEAPLWLPTSGERVTRKRKVALMRLSPARERMLLADLGLVSELLAARRETPIPGLLELDADFIDLQRVFYDAAQEAGQDETSAEVVTPKKGMLLLESATIDAARLLRSAEARPLADWVLGIPEAVIERLASQRPKSPAALRYPESLGATPADDAAPVRSGPGRIRVPGKPLDPAAVVANAERVRAFYRALLIEQSALLSLRWRE